MVDDLEFAGRAGSGGFAHGDVVNFEDALAFEKGEFPIGEADHDPAGGFRVFRPCFGSGDRQERRDSCQSVLFLCGFHAPLKGMFGTTLKNKYLTGETACLTRHMGLARHAARVPLTSAAGLRRRWWC